MANTPDAGASIHLDEIHPDTRDNNQSHLHKKTPSPSRHSPVAPLAPLEYLQNQRRGSITDPSLHAATHNAHSHSHISNSSRHSDSSTVTGSSALEPRSKAPLSTRPASPYIFGDASLPANDSSGPHLRRVLRTPTGDRADSRTPPSRPIDLSQEAHAGHPRAGSRPPEHNKNQGQRRTPEAMDTDDANQQMPVDPDHSNEPQNFDYNMRRHSIATTETGRGLRGHTESKPSSRGPYPPSTSHGVKRKMSSDRSMFPPVGEDIDPQLVGPGMTAGMNVDMDGPVSKRRGSAFDTQRIAQLSLYDRRDSVDSRTSQWWVNDRRDSSSSMMSTPSLGSSPGGYTSSPFSGDSPHGRPSGGMATFAWPSAQNSDAGLAAGAGMDREATDSTTMSGTARPFDPAAVSPLSMMQTMPFVADRRQSAPEIASTAGSLGPTRTLRSRSRPPSRAGGSMRGSDPSNVPPMPAGGSPDDGAAASPSPSASGTAKDGTTPYSRSPELRVSHKLAERKRRKEMKDLFDELRDQLPADRGMKASKWEILSKAIDFVTHLKQGHQELTREVEMLRHELDTVRQGMQYPPGPPPHHIVYAPGPTVVPPPFPPPGPPPVHQAPLSRPGSSQNIYHPHGQMVGGQNGNKNGTPPV